MKAVLGGLTGVKPGNIKRGVGVWACMLFGPGIGCGLVVLDLELDY